MNIKKISSIKHKTLFYLILFSVFILLLLWESQLIMSNYLYEKYQIKDMNAIAEEVSKKDKDELPKYLKNVVYNNAVCIEHTNREGMTVLYNDAATGCLLGREGSYLEEYKQDLRDSGEVTKAIKLVNNDYKAYALLYGVETSDGYVYLFTMLSNVNKNYRIIKDQLIYITIMVIALALIISLFLSKVISEPIVEITNKSKELAKGNYDVKFEKNGIKEIDELADTLGYLENEVKKTDEYRRDLMANVSHDLKTPLTMIKAYAEMVRDITYKDKEKREKNLNVIIEESDRLNILVNDILELSKLQENSTTLNLESFDLVEEINSVLKRYDILKENEGYEIISKLPKKALVKADKNRISQVIYNLINNALNYTGDDKKVTIKVTSDKKDYLIEIIDSGKGIEPEKIEHIWDKYYKNEKNHKRNVMGTGLGLSIVKNILEQHKFKYGVNSIINKGTTFYFRIPKDNSVKK